MVKAVNPNLSLDIVGTSFHRATVNATRSQLVKLFGTPFEYGDVDEKIQFQWVIEVTVDDGLEVRTTTMTIYDWKQYEYFFDDEEIEWHIGGTNQPDEFELKDYIENELNKL